MVCACDSGQSDSRRQSSAEKTSPPAEGLKRSERLRDRRVHYADMLQGVLHPRSDPDTVEPARTGQQSNRRPTFTVADTRLDSSTTMLGGRTSGTQRRVRSSDAVLLPVEPPATTNNRRRSMELRSTSDKLTNSDAVPVHVSVTSSPVSPSAGRRRVSEIPPRTTTITSAAGVVECSTKQTALKPNPRRHPPSNVRHRRRMAGRRRPRHFPLSVTQLANTSPPDTSQQPDSCSEVALSECSGQLNVEATVDSHLVDGLKVQSSADTRVSKVVDDSCCRLSATIDSSDAMQNSMESCSSEAGTTRSSTRKTSSFPISTAADISALCTGGVQSLRVGKPVANLVPVMHVGMSGGRFGRRHRCQGGVVVLDRYISADAACVMCCSCSQLFSVADFLRHTHHYVRGSADVLGSAKRLGPLGVAGPGWREFQHRQVLFALDSTCAVNLPADDQTIAGCLLTEASPSGPADTEDTNDGIVAAVSAMDVVGKTDESVGNLPPSPVSPDFTNQDTSSSDKVESMPLMPVVGHDMKDACTERCPAPMPSAEVIADTSPGASSENVAGIIAARCPPTAVDVAEPRLTRSRCTSATIGVIRAQPSPSLPSLRSQSGTVDSSATAAPQHSERNSKQRLHIDSASTRHTRSSSSGSVDSSSSRVELRPRPPPRATAPK